jgi:hypothetical protein
LPELATTWEETMALAVSWKMAATALAFGFVAAMLLGMV